MSAITGENNRKDHLLDFKLPILCRKVAVDQNSVVLNPNILITDICNSYEDDDKDRNSLKNLSMDRRGRCIKKALLSWEKVCFPKTAGGYNVLDVHTWNRAAIYKLLWNICKKKDKLWVQWIHLYYGKKQEVGESNPRNTSWIVQKIIKAKRYVEVAGINMKEMEDWNYFSTKKFYKGMREQFQKVTWKKLTCNGLGAPKWTCDESSSAKQTFYKE